MPKPIVVLIGPMSNDPAESVSGVNRAFIQGLQDRYTFVPLEATRTLGNTRQAKLNSTNVLYFVQQLMRWTGHLIRRRPSVAHYAISSGWAMEKGLMFMRLARLFGAKTLGHLHSGEFIDHWQSLPKWRRAWAAREFKKLDGLVMASEWWRGEIGKHLPLPADKLFVVNNPIDFGFEQAAVQMPLERAGNVILALGVMGRPKGIMEILAAADALSKNVKFDLRLVGAEREPGILKTVNEYVASHSLSNVVTVTASISNQEKLDLFKTAGTFLLPSYFENFPLVIIEAAAAGMAIVTTPVGAVPEFFKDGESALFVEPGNAEQITAALADLAAHPEKRLRLGRAARALFLSRLARTTIMDSLDGVYRQVSNRGAKPPV